jgi:ATP-dependent metalloprotease FtsH
MALRSFMVAFYCLILFRLYQSISGASGAGNKDVPGKLASSDLPMASFEEIQGIDDAKLEVMELVDTLRNPEKYAILGARAPTGLLLEGPPGTGKTMLARATAASAGVPLLYCSGSDFVEMFVGRGAARVRKLFERAARLSPCIIFVDELDALGKSRDAGGGIGPFSRSNDEAEQTLNQLLACMDGLDSSRRICVLAATNRKDVLDSALIRPGRFDRIVKLKLPDTNGRENILRVHCTKLPGFQEGSGVDSNRTGSLGKGRRVDLAAISVMTEGFSGAELEFLVNEAAIRAVRRVSSALAQNQHANDIVPHVEAEDFEASLANFYETRKSKKGVWNNVFK